MDTEIMDTQQTLDYEQMSYGKWGYKRIQRLRRKGKRRGIDVPELNFQLTKPEKPRVAFWIAAIVGIVVFVGIMVGTGFLIKFLVDIFSDLYKDSGGFFKTLLNPKVLFVSQGLSFVPVLLLIAAYLLLASMAIIPISLAICCYRFVRNMLYMARCSKEEFARGEMITGSIVSYVFVLVAATILLIAIFVLTDAHMARLLVGLIYAGIVIIFGGLLALIVVERRKCGKWFETLDEDKKQNFLEHEKALSRIKSRLGFERRMWNNMFK